MRTILLRSATILHPQSPVQGKKADVLIADGIIEEIGQDMEVSNDIQVVKAEGMFLSPGFFDLNVNFGDPGFETAEDMLSGAAAAVAGGFTGVAVHPNTKPPLHSKAEIAYLINKAKGNLVDIYPLGCISRERHGKDLAELYDMKQTGAIAFTDGNRPVADAGLMSRALLYSKGFDGLIFSYPEDEALAGPGKMNEGVVSTYLGIKGIPALAEELIIARDLYLAEYNDARIHFSTISSTQSVELIRQAKKKGIKTTCDIAAHHLALTENELEEFDSNYKVKPPLRTHADAVALLEGLKDGTIDAIVSQHTPHEVEFKNVEFEIAAFGIISLQTVLPLLLKAGLTPEEIVEKLAINPRKVLGLPIPQLQVGEIANLTLFDTKAEWVLNEKTNQSKSANSPFFNQKLQGGIVLVANNKKLWYAK